MHKNSIFNFSTNETLTQYIARCGTDRCDYCNQDVPKDWGQQYLGGKFECVRCEEMREDVRND